MARRIKFKRKKEKRKEKKCNFLKEKWLHLSNS